MQRTCNMYVTVNGLSTIILAYILYLHAEPTFFLFTAQPMTSSLSAKILTLNSQVGHLCFVAI